MAKVVGRHKGHVIEGETTGEKGIKITSWALPDGKPAPKKAGIVGETFATVGRAGVAVFEAMNKNYGTPENLKGRWMIFKAPGATRPINSRDVKPKTAKAGKEDAEEDPRTGSGPKAKSASKSKASSNGAKADAPVKVAKGQGKAKGPSRKAKDPRATQLIYAMKSQEGVPAGQTRFRCSACGDDFTIKTPKGGVAPTVCPEGHDANDPQFAAIYSREGLEVEELAL